MSSDEISRSLVTEREDKPEDRAEKQEEEEEEETRVEDKEQINIRREEEAVNTRPGSA